MWPLRTTLIYYRAVWQAYARRYRSTEGHIQDVIDGYRAENAPEHVPDYVVADGSVVIEKTYFESGASTQRWQVFTCLPDGTSGQGNDVADEREEGPADESSPSRNSKVLVHFHGGGFTRASSSNEWQIPHHALRNHRIPVIYPVWTLAPLSCATEFARVAVAFLIAVADDARWEGKEIVLTGMSAGGWCVLRTLLALCEMSIQEKSDQASRAAAVVDRIRQVALFSPVTNLEVTEDLRAAEERDSFLSYDRVAFFSRLWAYGPSIFPTIFTTLPDETRDAATKWKEELDGVSLDDPRLSPNNGLDALARFIDARPAHPPFQVVTFHGTADILYPQVQTMHERLNALGEKYAQSELISGEGMWHAWMFYSIAEAGPVYQRFSDILDG